MSVVHKHMKLAVQADLDYLFKRKPILDPHDTVMVENQMLEMLAAERRGEKYDCDIPWRSKDWHGINVPYDAKDIAQEVPKPAKLRSRATSKTGVRRTTKGES